MAKIGNKGTVPAGMLAPSGYVETPANPNVQATTRPAGTLLRPSPGYDSIRMGRNRFQGRGPSGGFKPMEYAEDVGGTGAALSIIPGQTTAEEASEWLPENLDSLPEGSIIIADRTHEPGFATRLHEAYGSFADMGDRHPSRPLSRAAWLQHPLSIWRKDYHEHPAVTILATAGLVYLINIVARDVESGVRGYRPSGPGTAVTTPAADVAGGAGDAAQSVSRAAENAVDKIGQTTDAAVEKISSAADSAVDSIKNAAT